MAPPVIACQAMTLRKTGLPGAYEETMKGHDPYACFKDVLTRLLTQQVSDIEQLLLHVWMLS